MLSQRIEAMEIKGAIDELLALGLLVQTPRSHAQPLYGLNQQKLGLQHSIISGNLNRRPNSKLSVIL